MAQGGLELLQVRALLASSPSAASAAGQGGLDEQECRPCPRNPIYPLDLLLTSVFANSSAAVQGGLDEQVFLTQQSLLGKGRGDWGEG